MTQSNILFVGMMDVHKESSHRCSGFY